VAFVTSNEELFMLDVIHSQVDVEIRVWCGITDSDIFINFSFDKMIFNNLQVSRDRGRLLTAYVQHFNCVVYCKKGHCFETMRV